jgi:hypothetical protein
MKMEDAWVPIDEVAGTAVDTVAYGVERGDGVFYPSKVARMFGDELAPFTMIAYWRTWKNMQSLIERGLDPLTVLIDRAHEKNMEFIASLRMSGYLGMDPSNSVESGGRGMANETLRDHKLAVLKELATDYSTDGVEMDFPLAPMGGPSFRKEDVAEYTPVMTEFVRNVSSIVRNRPGGAGTVGARVYPTEEMNRDNGLDVRTWLKEGLLDYVAPMLYIYFVLDPDMPMDWIVEPAHDSDTAVYGVIQPYAQDASTGAPAEIYPTPEIMHAAAANYWDKGVDGLYHWFMRWPLGNTERRILSELGDPDLVAEADKHYLYRRRSEKAAEAGYGSVLPLTIPEADESKSYEIPLRIADDPVEKADRIRQIKLKLVVDGLCTADKIRIHLNGESLSGTPCIRSPSGDLVPYGGQTLEFLLTDVRPQKGANLLEFALLKRPDDLAGGVVILSVEVIVEYGFYPSGV